MWRTYRVSVCLLVFVFLLVAATSTALGQGRKATRLLPMNWRGKSSSSIELGAKSYRETANRVSSRGSYRDEVELNLYEAMTSRLGVPYKLRGTDERGFDCSGFVWRVFHDAGVEFDRTTARTLWETLPEATEKERTRFGTLVFFEDGTHVGIVRDAHSFYHASSSRGVVRSYFSDNSEYWGQRVLGYRRALPTNQVEPLQRRTVDIESRRWRIKGKRRTK